MRIAIFASGTGSNAEAIIQAQRNGQLQAEIALVVTDNPQAKVIERVQPYNIPVQIFEPKEYENKDAFEHAIIDVLRQYDITFIVLAGYMRLVGPALLEWYEGNMVNIHPSLLPSFPGLHAIEQAYNANVKITGVTIHYVDAGMDTGPIIAQEAVRIEETDTIETLTEKIQKVEHKLYPKTIEHIVNQTKGLDGDE